MKIGVVGAGAIGGWLAANLARSGQEVSVVARNATLAAIERDGIRVATSGRAWQVRVAVSDDPRDFGAQDLVILSVKGPALAGAAPSVAAMCHDDTMVLSAMNGVPWWFFRGLPGALKNHSLRSVDPTGSIAGYIAPERVVGCVVHASCSSSAPGCIDHAMGNELIIGEPNGTTSARLERLGSVLHHAGYTVKSSGRIQSDVWYKLWGNMTLNPISALTGATADRILDEPLAAAFAAEVMREAAAVGDLLGCPIGETIDDRNRVTRKLGAFKTSMLRDAEAHRSLEIDSLLGAPREIAAILGRPTPAMDALHGLLRLFASVKGLD